MQRPPVPPELSTHLLHHEALPTPLDWVALFGRVAPVEVEVGSGKGLFLATVAAMHPDRDYFGIEMAASYAKRAAQRAKKRGLSNVKVAAADARRVLAQHVTDGSVAAVHVYFPDPWWKKRHRKRRVFSAEFLADVVRALSDGGELRLATDVEEYFEVMCALVAARPELSDLSVPEPGEPKHELDYLTNFERKFRLEGRAIHRASYRKGLTPLSDAVPDSAGRS